MSLAKVGDRVVSNGALSVYAHAYSGEGAAPGARCEGLRVTPARGPSGTGGPPALFHPSSALYGMLGLAAGALRVHLVDPAGAWLPRAARTTVPDRTGVTRAILAGAVNPPRGPAIPRLAVPMRPGIAWPFRPSDTVVWGTVTRGGRPVPFARIEVTAGATPTSAVQYTTWTDLSGVWVADLRAERVTFLLPPDDDDDTTPPVEPTLITTFTRQFLCWLPKFTVPQGDVDRVLTAFPHNFDDMVADTTARAAAYTLAATTAHAVVVGRRTELRFTFPA